MRIARIRAAGRGGYLRAVIMEDGRRFVVLSGIAGTPSFVEGAELTASEEQALAVLDEERRARETAHLLLCYRPRSRAELASRLRRRGVGTTAVEATLHELTQEGLVDDRRFAHFWAESRLEGGRSGPYRIRMELREKGVEADLIEETLAALVDPQRETALAAALAERHLQRTRRLPEEVRIRRLAGFLRRRGFSGSVIGGVLRHAAPRGKLREPVAEGA